MRTLPIITLLLISLAWASCTKSDSAVAANQRITGTWNLVSDSTFAAGLDAPNHASVSNKYTGVSGDNFTFTDNKVYIKESTVKIDTATYTINKDTLKMVYAHFSEVNGYGTIANAHISYLISDSPNMMVLSSIGLTSPAGEFSEVIKLTK